MNTMVGMQASLHTPTEDSLSELMKSGDVDGSVGVGPSPGGSATQLDLDVEDGDDFDADELLKSPLFNDSAEKLVTEEESFGDFGPSEAAINDGSSNIIQSPITRTKREFVPMGLRRSDDSNFATMKQHQLQQAQMSPQQHQPQLPPFAGNDQGDSLLYGDLRAQPPFQNNTLDNGVTSQAHFSPQVGTVPPQMNGFHEGNQMLDDSSHAEFAIDDESVGMVNPYLTPAGNNKGHIRGMYVSSPERSNSNASSSYESDASPAPRPPGNGMLDVSQHSQMSSSQGMDISQNAQMFTRAPPQRSQTYHPGASRNPLEMMKEHHQQGQQHFAVGGGNGDVNQLEMMQQHLQQMNEMDRYEMQMQQQRSMENNAGGIGGMNMSRSMNMPSRSASCGPTPTGVYNDGLGSFRGGGAFNNMGRPGGGSRLPSDLELMQNELGAQMLNGGGGPANGSGGGPVTVNDAMEKLCESMKRSAMSRTLVKQFSSGARGVARTNSAGMMMGGRPMGGPNVRRSNSNRNLPMDDNSHRSTDSRPAVPMRRVSNTKHHLQRGVYRHGSGHLTGVNNMGNSNISLQIDGRNMGSL